MLWEAIEHLAVKDGVYVDATLGGGGYAEAILEASATAKVFGFDTDPAAQEFAANRLAKFGERFMLVQENFAKLHETLAKRGVSAIEGIVYDLGVSSHQLDTASVGLSYRVEAPLDMRLDPRLKVSAKDIVNRYDLDDLTKIFREYGEERFARMIARQIVGSRWIAPIETTTDLAEVVTQEIRE